MKVLLNQLLNQPKLFLIMDLISRQLQLFISSVPYGGDEDAFFPYVFMLSNNTLLGNYLKDSN